MDNFDDERAATLSAGLPRIGLIAGGILDSRSRAFLSPTIGLILLTPEERAGIFRRRVRAFALWRVLAWLLMAAVLIVQGIAVFAAPHPLQPSFGDILGFIGVVAVLPLFLLLGMRTSIPSRVGVLGSAVLQNAILRADSAFAPRAERQPELLVDGVPVEMGSALPKHPIHATLIDRFTLLGAFMLAGLGALCFIPVALSVLGIIPSVEGAGWYGFIGLYLPIGLSVIGTEFVNKGLDALHPPLVKSLAIDDEGIHWRENGRQTRERALPWREIRAFCVQKRLFSQTYQMAYTYLLLGRETTFGWIVWQSPKAPEYQASGLLGQLVVTKTGLPLLDISESLDALYRLTHQQHESTLGQSARRTQAALEQAIAREGIGQPVLISPEFEQQIDRPLSRLYLRDALVMALLTLGFCVAWLLHG